jgi:hypothetical protein
VYVGKGLWATALCSDNGPLCPATGRPEEAAQTAELLDLDEQQCIRRPLELQSFIRMIEPSCHNRICKRHGRLIGGCWGPLRKSSR